MTRENHIVSAVARAAAAEDWPISGVSVISPLVGSSPCLIVNWFAFLDKGADGIETPAGVSTKVLDRVPCTVLPLPPMADIETYVIDAAWAHGAWDIKRTVLSAGYGGPLPPYAAGIEAEIQRHGSVTWYWRPMLRGPEVRAKANGKKDITLNQWSLGRDGDAPDLRTTRLSAGQHIIRLGREHRSRTEPRATPKQRGYLGCLLRQAGEDDTLPDNLTLAAASAWIDRLAPNRKKGRPRANANQIRMIWHLQQSLGLNVWTARDMTYDEAQHLIAELRGRIKT